MAKIIQRIKPVDEVRKDLVDVERLSDLRDGDLVVTAPNSVWAVPAKVEREVHEKVEGTVVIELTELEAAVLKALTGKVNQKGDAELGRVAGELYWALENAQLQTKPIQLFAEHTHTRVGALNLQYGPHDYLHAMAETSLG